MKIPKSTRKFIDDEIADDQRRQKAQEKAFGKKTIRYFYSVQDACSDLLHFGPKDLKKVQHIDVTVSVELKNGEKWGRTISSVPNMPKRVTKRLNEVYKKAKRGKPKG